MKNLIIAMTFAFLLSSCVNVHNLPKLEHKIKCNDDFNSISSRLVQYLLQDNFIIKNNDEKSKFIFAETMPEYSALAGVNVSWQWTIRENNDTLIARCIYRVVNQNAYGASTYSSDYWCGNETHVDNFWYWNIRNALESICENKVIIFDSNIKKTQTQGNKGNQPSFQDNSK